MSLNITGLKDTLAKPTVAVNIYTLEIIQVRFLNESIISDGGNLCPLWLVTAIESFC